MTYTIPDSLFSYQKEDLDRLLSCEDGFLNLSEMGTGKTPVSIGLALKGNYFKTLIVCPKSLMLEWKRQIIEWTGIIPTVARRGCYRRLEPLTDEVLKGTPYNPFFIVNYETFATLRHRECLEQYPFDLMIMDEAHRLKNPRAKRTRGMRLFLDVQKQVRVIALTGSPIVNNPADLHTILTLVRPDKFTPEGRNNFIRDFCTFTEVPMGKRCPACKFKTGRWSPMWQCPRCGTELYNLPSKIKITGIHNMEELRKITAPYTIRRTKKECLPFLPDKYYRKVLLSMKSDQWEVYRQMEDELFILLDSGEEMWAASVLSKLTRLRQLNLEPRVIGSGKSSAKTDFLLDLLEDNLKEDSIKVTDGTNGHPKKKVVIFSCFEKYIYYLHHLLPYKHVCITGMNSMEERAEAVKQFQNDPDIRICMGTIQCMGEGVTLTAADTVILMDRWWSPALNHQAEDRLHRIGQKNAVEIIIPVIEHTVDESFDKILQRKEALSQEFLNDNDTIAEVLTDLRQNRTDNPITDMDKDDSDEKDEDDEENGGVKEVPPMDVEESETPEPITVVKEEGKETVDPKPQIWKDHAEDVQRRREEVIAKHGKAWFFGPNKDKLLSYINYGDPILEEDA